MTTFNRALVAFLPLLLAACGSGDYAPQRASLTMFPLPEAAFGRTLNVRGEVKSLGAEAPKVSLKVGKKVFPATVSNGVYEATVELQAGQNEITAQLEGGPSATSRVRYGETLSAGAAHSAAIHNGKLYAWGKNNLGQAGNGGLSEGELPFNLAGDWAALSFNANFSLGIDGGGRVQAWGDGSQGQMGKVPTALHVCHKDRTGTPSFCQKTPSPIAGLSDVVSVQAGGGHALALTRGGEVYAWGENGAGQVQAGAPELVSEPLRLALPEKMVVLAGQGQTSYALGESGKVYAWGDNEVGQLGQGDLLPHAGVVVVPLGRKALQIAAGGSHALALLENGEVYAWGENFQHQVGPHDPAASGSEVPTPRRVEGVPKVERLRAGGNTSAVRSENGEIFVWGLYSDEMEDLGGMNVPVSKELERPTRVLSNFKADELAFGALHQLAKSQGRVFAWGWNSNRSLGSDGLLDNWMQALPAPVLLP